MEHAVQEPIDDRRTEDLVRRLATIGYCLSPSFSADSRQLAFVSDLSGVPQVWTVASSGGWPNRVTALMDQVQDVSWSPDGEWLAFSLAPGGGMNAQVYVIRPDGTELRLLTAGGKDNNRLGRWSDDGGLLAIGSSRRTPEAIDACLADVATSELRLVAMNDGIGGLVDVSPDNRWGLLYRVRQRSDSDLYLVDLETGDEVHLTPHEGPGAFAQARFGADRRTVYLASNFEREMVALMRIDIVDGHPGPIELIAGRDDAELEGFTLSRDRRTAVLNWNCAGRSELEFMDLSTGEFESAPPLPVHLAISPTFSAHGGSLAFVGTGAAAPPDIWILDRAGGSYSQVTATPHPGVDLDGLVRPELHQFTAHDGVPLSGWLYRPVGSSGPGPMVAVFHGGPEAQERPIFSATYQALVARGVALFASNVRGSAGFGKTYINLDNGALRWDAVRDIRTCVEYAIEAGVAAPGRIGIMGGSYGGFMTMAGLTQHPDLFAAGATICGVVNFETFFAHTEPWMAAISKVEYGDPDTEAELLRDLSPIHRLDRVAAPVLVVHGANDTNVPVVEADQVVETLRDRGIECDYILFPDEGHGVRKADNRIRYVTEMVGWFATHLKAT